MEKKVGGVILTHGQLANGLLTAAETVVGEIPFITAVSIGTMMSKLPEMKLPEPSSRFRETRAY
jgi:mannose/fructose-specific phosphotransferase system component IIA